MDVRYPSHEQTQTIRAIFFDLDGTLTDDRQELSEKTVAAVRAIEQLGIVPVIATGRSFEAVGHYISALDMKGPVICYNGAVIYDCTTGAQLHEVKLDEEIARKIIELGRARSLHVQGFRHGELLFEQRREEALSYQKITGLVGKVVDFDRLEQLDFIKLLFVGSQHEAFAEVAETLDRLYGERVTHFYSLPEFYEMMDGSVSKERAVEMVLDDLDIPLSQAMAFGDGDNDAGMLREVGFGVAMENAAEPFRARAEYIAGDHDDDGVARYLDRLFGLGLF